MGKLTHCKQLFIEIEVFNEEQKTLQFSGLNCKTYMIQRYFKTKYAELM